MRQRNMTPDEIVQAATRLANLAKSIKEEARNKDVNISGHNMEAIMSIASFMLPLDED
ncbi:hypothetical protein J9K13_000439 [Salmonella enterica]|nr:hypothetical protein [Salmonella enterica]EHK2733000.1 hypothetical protein [Salmonella enterica]HEC8454191.1 hypothetical protein [Salmonella enterica subsp. enterica serovar Poona]